MELNRDFSEFMACFAAHDVRFLIVGGYAVAAHGHPRYTKDLDVWVRVDPDNARRIIEALEEFGFGGLGLSVDDFLEDQVVVQLGREPQRIDLLTFASGVDFDEAFANRVLVDFGDTEVPVIGRTDLRRNKLATGRLRDLADLEDLGLPGPDATEDDPG
ncbi:MAG: hypothetical protein RIE08_13460 [Acidimicrobiales bacterium]